MIDAQSIQPLSKIRLAYLDTIRRPDGAHTLCIELKIDKQNQSYNRVRRNLFEHLYRQTESAHLWKFASYNRAG